MVLPQKARNAQNLLAEKSLPQMAQIYTEVMVLYGGEVLWENISQKVTTEERLVDRLEDFAFPSLSTSLYSAYNVSITAMLADMADFWYITKTPNKTTQKHQTKHHKNTKQFA